jgi:hypothetical protein
MQFKGKASRIRYFAYILNLVVKVILKELGFNIYKAALEFLNNAAKQLTKKRWQKIIIPGATSIIAKL